MPTTPDQEELSEQIQAAYMRGFRCAVNLDDPGPMHPESHFGRGYYFGSEIVMPWVLNQAAVNAGRVVTSPAMAQARANAESSMHGQAQSHLGDMLHEKYPPLPNTPAGRAVLKEQIKQAVLDVLPPVKPLIEFDEPTKEQIANREISGTMGFEMSEADAQSDPIDWGSDEH